MVSIFEISQLTTATASVLGAAYVAGQNGTIQGVGFMICGFLFTLFLRVTEQIIFDYNIYHGNIRYH